MHGLEFVVVLVIAVPLTFFLLKYKGKLSRRRMEEYFKDNNLDAAIEKVGMPPARLWIHNRKGDGWVLVRMADGSQRWARLGFRRRRVDGKVAVEFFD